MLNRFAPLSLVSLAVLIVVAPASAQSEAPPPPAPASEAPAPKPATVKVSLQTSEGLIILELEKERAPITTANFLRYVDQKRWDGANFYRSAKVAPGFGLIQGGVRNNPSKVLPPIAHEPTTQTHLTHDEGAISMARAAPGSAAGDFFITIGSIPSMDATPDQPGDNLGFAVFGHVVQGMDLVHRILDAPTSPTEGEGAMKGQILLVPVRIITARRMD
ncbi:peptidyl-prolyl cis-trans isomerase [Sphingomonas sp. DBB INV C78]|uniref:peptidylprolyl isomerase n=1 Tax=Sphingomonas sp. DBB INV C78 TaxID=3349434 RepID=UPI0036D23E1B